MIKKYKTIGILGGMGPAATADLYNQIISIFQNRFDAKYDKDFPEIVIISLPIPDVVEEIENEKRTVEMLINAAKRLEKVGCSFISIPCNTVHVYLDNLKKSVKIPILSIIEEVSNLCKKDNFLNVGLLSSEFIKNVRIYDLEFSKLGITIKKLNAKYQSKLTKLIIDIMNGKLDESNKRILLNLIDYLKEKNSEAIILGCTELPLIIKQEDCDIKLIDTIELLAEACVRESIKSYINMNKR